MILSQVPHLRGCLDSLTASTTSEASEEKFGLNIVTLDLRIFNRANLWSFNEKGKLEKAYSPKTLLSKQTKPKN